MLDGFKILNKLVATTFEEEMTWDGRYFYNYFGRKNMKPEWVWEEDYKQLELPIVMDTMYHTIKSDGEHILIELK